MVTGGCFSETPRTSPKISRKASRMADDNTTRGNRLLRLSDDELVWLNNALNEVCNGVDIDDSEFPTRLGGSRQDLKALLARINTMLQL
jgi:hypothetical protein